MMLKNGRERFLRPKEVADFLGVSRTTVYRLVASKKLKAIRLPSGHHRIILSTIQPYPEKIHSEEALPEEQRVLIIDDEPRIGESIQKFFQRAEPSWKIQIATSAFEAGTLIQSFHPKVIILDLMMPSIDGFSICRSLKADEKTRDITVIAITGYPSSERIDKILKAGASICLVKPFDYHQLLSLVRQYLDSYRQVRKF
ncbi:MAG: response regulator [Candidatus Omnitrophica bacterium]|nr:response regulator [Candidatus Omnitrophota bacterium]